MDKFRILYYCLLLVSFILSVSVKKNELGLRVFPYLLATSLIAEISSQLLKLNGNNFYIIYHFYVPIEYALWAYYFYLINSKLFLKRILLISIPAFSLLCLIISINLTEVDKFPNIHLNIEGILLITIAAYTVFTIKAEKGKGLFSRSVFWISVAILIYHTIISPFIGLYNYVLESTDDLHAVLQLYLLYVPNYIFYTFLSIAFICSQRMKK